MRLAHHRLYVYELRYARPVRWSDIVEDAAPDLRDAEHIFITLRSFRTASNYGALLKEHRNLLKKDAIEAYRWFATAGLYGDDAMINRVTGVLLQLEEQMTEADLAKAQDAVPDWENRLYRPQATLETLAEP